MAAYKNLKNDNKNFTLMMGVGVALSTWRENYGKNDIGAFDPGVKPLTVWSLAKAINERYESVYRIEHGGGTPTTLVKYLMYIDMVDPKFDFLKKVREIMGTKKVSEQDLFSPKQMENIPFKD